jgi:predicted flap endonuclease-1-like 5' DNA nuclease
MTKLTTIEGIGPALTEQLAGAGVNSVETLLETGGTKAGRAKIADASGLSEARILKLVNCADLMRIKGVGGEYSELLEAAGVDTVPELAQRNAKNLQESMEKLNVEKKLVRSVPSLKQVEGWVDQAKTLPRAIEH